MLRLSNNFLLLDFLYDQSTMDCVVHCGEQLSREVASKLIEDSEVVAEGRYLCKTILDRIVEEHGPVSISAGLWFQDLPEQGKAHYPDNPVHRWSQEYGAAADVVVHSWVNQNKNPEGFKESLPGSNIEYHRFLSYHRDRSSSALHLDRKATTSPHVGMNKWDRRKPYTHSHGAKSKSNCGYDKQLRVAESSWCEESDTGLPSNMVGTVVFGRKPPKRQVWLHHSIVEIEGTVDDRADGGRRVVRPWHVRVSEYFVLLDFCRNEKMFERGMVTVPPLTFRTANTVIKVARMFGEVLDPVKKHLGNISVVRGMEPKGFAEAGDARARYHRWVPAICDTHSVEFVTPIDPNSGYLDLLERDKREGRVVDFDAKYDSVFGGDRVCVTIRSFNPNCHFTSATGEEFPWTA